LFEGLAHPDVDGERQRSHRLCQPHLGHAPDTTGRTRPSHQEER
jgi:hypothetical protein